MCLDLNGNGLKLNKLLSNQVVALGIMWIKRFIARIQNSEERIKRRWMILFSVAAVMVIIAFWIFFTIPVFQISSVSSSVEVVDEPGFWQILKNGMFVVFDSTIENFKNIFSRITEKKTIIIE
ncbi:MAG: hypothetical protein ABIH10_02240 [Spirochaetota bacterium]